MKQCYIVILVLIKVIFVATQQDYCFSSDSERKQTRQFATKTGYVAARGHDEKIFDVPKCEAKKLWLLSRHGTRNPSAKTMEQMRKLVEIRDAILENFKKNDTKKLCSEDLENLKNWKLDGNLTAEYDNYLTLEGWSELKNMAIDYQRAFQNIIETKYSKEKFTFRFTDTQRGEASYKAFVEGLFGLDAYKNIDASAEKNTSILLRPYEICDKWDEQGDLVKGPDSEFIKFQETEVFKKTLEEVSVRLGYNQTLSIKTIGDIWDMCRYDQAWHIKNISAWCAAFTPEHVNVLEYWEDLSYYVKSGHGGKLNDNMMCAAIQDMMKFVESEDIPKVAAYFAHASTIQLLLTGMGYAKDSEPLRADNFNQMKNRKFMTSILSPFASNIAVVKYDCPDEESRHKVRFFLNEKPIMFEWCSTGLCDLSMVLQKYEKFLNADCKSMYCGGTSINYLNLSVIILSCIAVLRTLF